jgi:predicted ferric reductase
MSEKLKRSYIIPAIVIYLFIPLLYLILGDFPERTVLKNFLSFLTIEAFFLMLAQFYLARSNSRILKGHKMATVIKIHKVLGYIFIPVLMLHPFFVVLPRFFESGVDPMEAFTTMMTTFSSRGIVIGIIAWVLMVLLGLTSLLRKKLPMKYTSWRVFHGILSIAFIVLATIHAVNLGRHTNVILSVYMIAVALAGVLALVKIYLLKPQKAGIEK